MSNLTGKPEKLPHIMCLFIDMPPSNIACSEDIPPDCVQCGLKTGYFTGESINDYYSTGHMVCLLLWILSATGGILGFLGNICVITILKKRAGSNQGFDFLLIFLAFFDIICCLMAVVVSTTLASFFGGWGGRGSVMFYVFNASWIGLLFGKKYFIYLLDFKYKRTKNIAKNNHTLIFSPGRTATQFMTVAVTFERFLVITFPQRSTFWFNGVKTKVLCGVVLLIAILLSIPRSTSRQIIPNQHRDIPNLESLEYILWPTKLNKFWYEHLHSVHYQIDFWLPTPVLLIFNFLSYLQVSLNFTEKSTWLSNSVIMNLVVIRQILKSVLQIRLENCPKKGKNWM